MSNAQSNESLREINAKLLAEITELRKENAEIPKLREKLLKFEAENAKIPDLRMKFADLKAERTELKARIAEVLRQSVEENKRRDAENAKLKARIGELESEFRDRITKVEQKQTLNDNSSNNSSSNSNLVADQVSMVTHHEKPLVDTLLPEDKETDAFLDEVDKRKDSSSTTSESLHHEADLSMTDTKHDHPEQVVKKSVPKESSLVHMEPQKIEEKQVNLSEINEAKIPYNQKVEQDLICELLEFIRCRDSTSLPNSISSKHIPDVPVDADLTPGSVPHLAHLFDKAEKTGRKEKLRWYYYSEEYEKKVVTLRSENNISDQMARTQIYDEMELYLPGKKREYLRKMTQKAKNIYTLFKGIGIDKIGVVTSSADAISRLTDAQILNIINELTKSQKLIGTNVRSQSKPTYDRSYFCNKTLGQYPTLYREFSSEKFDYYGITDETSCPLCKLEHGDEESVEEKGNMTKSDKILTPEYLDWRAKLTGLPKKSQATDFKPITYEAKPDPELIIKSVLKHFTYLKFRNSFRGIDNYNFAFSQPWSHHALFVMENMGIMDYMANGIKMKRNIVLPATLQTINLSSRS
ncbi:610_t:CDS:2 [Gigaspora rosea]|nr:610_t:CDS:2 [Gigaspora rosea]